MEKTLNWPQKVMGKTDRTVAKHPDIAQRLRELRSYRTQDDMARIAGVARATWSAIENGYQDVTIAQLMRISKYFGVTMDYLILGKESGVNPDYVNELEENNRVLRATVEKLLKD